MAAIITEKTPPVAYDDGGSGDSLPPEVTFRDHELPDPGHWLFTGPRAIGRRMILLHFGDTNRITDSSQPASDVYMPAVEPVLRRSYEPSNYAPSLGRLSLDTFEIGINPESYTQ